MEQNGLFLISWKLRQDPTSATPEDQQAITDQDKMSPLARKWQKTMAYWRQPRNLTKLWVGLAFCVMGDLIYFTHFAETNPYQIFSKPSDFLIKINSISLGEKRADVEKLLTQRSSDQPSLDGITRYALSSQVNVSIGYDSSGGVGSSENQVIVLPNLEMEGDGAGKNP